MATLAVVRKVWEIHEPQSAGLPPPAVVRYIGVVQMA